MTLSVLTDEQIGDLLENLTLEELDSFRESLTEALHEYSLGTQSKTAQDDEQPERTSIHSGTTGATTLFMPSRAPIGMGVKVITLSSPAAGNAPAPGSTPEVIAPTGAITLFSPQGRPTAILHASQLTAFRTALASLCLVQRRDSVKVLTVFGSGLQAYYHVRLALMSRGSTIRQVHIVNRNFSESCRGMLQRFTSGVPLATKQREGWADCRFGVLTPTYGEYARLLKEQVRAADVIFCCTPATAELFPAAHLTSNEGRRKKKGRLVVAIGSYTADMVELPVELLIQATRRHEGGHLHFHKHAAEGGVVIVDSLDGALKEAGEVIKAGLRPDQLVELGELVMLRRIQMQEEDDDNGGEGASGTAGDDGSSEGRSEPGSRKSSVMISSPSPSTLEFEKMDLGSSSGSIAGPSAMSTVYGPSSSSSVVAGPSSAAGGPSRSSTPTTTFATPGPSSRSSSPSRRSGIFSSFTDSTKRSSSSGGGPLKLHRRGSSSTTEVVTKKKQKEDHMATWLQSGNVIYKSVGLGLMDLAVGMHIVQFAKNKGIGTHVEGF